MTEAAANGYHPTPPAVADYAAAVAFGVTRPGDPENGRLLLPGFGTGRLYDAAMRYCRGESWYVPWFEYPEPDAVGVEFDAAMAQDAPEEDGLRVLERDFLLDPPDGPFDWVLANPPYSRYTDIPEPKRDQYRERFDLVTGQFPLHVPFFEQSMELLKPGGTLTFILPLSVFHVQSLEPLRAALREMELGPLVYLPSSSFDAQVETAIVSLEKTSTGTHSLWLENLRGAVVKEMLGELGVDDPQAETRDYFEEFRAEHHLVMNREWQREELREAAAPASESPTHSQIDLAAYAKGGADD